MQCHSNALVAKPGERFKPCSRRPTKSWVVWWDVIAEDGTTAVIQNWPFCTYHVNRTMASPDRFRTMNARFLPLLDKGTKRIALADTRA